MPEESLRLLLVESEPAPYPTLHWQLQQEPGVEVRQLAEDQLTAEAHGHAEPHAAVLNCFATSDSLALLVARLRAAWPRVLVVDLDGAPGGASPADIGLEAPFTVTALLDSIHAALESRQ